MGVVLTCGLPSHDLNAQGVELLREFVYESAPFPSCHASTIEETTKGTLITAWFGGTHEKHPDVGIWVSRKTSSQWSAPLEVANGIQYHSTDGTEVRYPTWNPVLFQPQQGPLLLFYKVGPTPQSWWGMLMSSSDDGVTWSAPTRLPEGILGPIKNKPIQLRSGEIVCPSSTEVPNSDVWQVHMEMTPDLGKTWVRSSELNDGKQFGAIQPSLLRLDENSLLAVGRTQQNRVFQMKSRDLGKTWGEMEASSLPNPNSGIDAVTLQDHRHLIVYNHIQGKDGHWGARSPLNLSVSNDGFDWKAAWVLENTPKEEFSYPAIIQTRDGLVHITYTWNRKKIRHVVIDPSQFKPRDINDGQWPSE